jgi:diacylglycerol kinase (ATP)
MNCLFIYNPNSGKGRINGELSYILKRLMVKFDQIDCHPTKKPCDAIDIARNACGVYKYMIFAGGDGTFNEIIQGISGEKVRPILGYIPTGTVNDIARTLGISRNVKKAIDIIIKGETIKHDICKANNQYFAYVAAAGTFSSISYVTKQQAKRALGKLAYFLYGLKDALTPYQLQLKLTLDGKQTVEGNYAMALIMNSKSVAGFLFNKMTKLNDGIIDIVLIENGPDNIPRRIWFSLSKIIKLFTLGLINAKKDRYVKHYQASKVMVEVGNNIDWCMDGEKGANGPLEIEVLKEHIQIFAKSGKINIFN